MEVLTDLRSDKEDKAKTSGESLYEDSEDTDDKSDSSFFVKSNEENSLIVESDKESSEDTDYSDTASESDKPFDSFVRETRQKHSRILKNISKVDLTSFEGKQKKLPSKYSLRGCFNREDEYSTESEILNSNINVFSKKQLKFKRKKRVCLTDDSDSEVSFLNSSDTKKINSALNSGGRNVDAKILESNSYCDNVLELAKKDNYIYRPSTSQMDPKLYHKCFKCNRKFITKVSLETHCLSHLKIKPYSCLFCAYETIYKGDLESHKDQHPEYKVPLKKLNLLLKKDKYISTLENEITGADVAECASPIFQINQSDVINDSDETLKEDLSFDTNMITWSPPITVVDSTVNNVDKFTSQFKNFSCYLCSFEASTNFALNKHYDNRHPKTNRQLREVAQTTTDENGVRAFLCPKCPFSTGKFTGWLSHYSKNHTDIDQPKNYDNLTVYSCQFCPFKTMSQGTFLLHLKKEHKKLSRTSYYKIRGQIINFTCYLCAFDARTTIELNKHYKKRHRYTNQLLRKIARTTTDKKGVRIFLCPKCPFSTDKFTGFCCHFSKKHTDSDQPENSDNKTVYCCQNCRYKTLSKATWQLHIKKKHRTSS